MKKSCKNCEHSYYDDLYYELCCEIGKEYIGEPNAKERAKNCKNYKRERF